MARRQITLDIPDDLDVLDNGIQFITGKDEVDYLWYYVREREAGHEYEGFRVVRLTQLDYLAMETRMDPDLLKKMWQVLWGQHRVSARVDFLHLVAGIFEPTPIGIVQLYGVCALGSTLDEAVEASRLGMAPLVANLRGACRQVRFRPLDSFLGEWITTKLARFRYVTSIIGHPDPRDVGASVASKHQQPSVTPGSAGSNVAFSDQQNERFFRAMAAAGHEFLWLLQAHPLPGTQVAQMLEGISDDASSWMSRAQGTKGISIGLSLPMLVSQSIGQSASAGYGTNASHSQASGLGTSYSQGHSVGYGESVGGSHSVGLSEARSVGHNWGISRSESWGTSSSVGQSASTSHGVGDSQGVGVAHGTSQTVTDSVGHSEGHSTGTSGFSSTSVSDGSSSGGGTSWGVGMSSSTGQGDSSGWNAGVNGGLHAGVSSNAGTGTSVNQSQGTSTGTTEGSNASLNLVAGQISGSGGSSNGTSTGYGVGSSANQSTGAQAGASAGASAGVSGSHSTSSSDGVSASLGGSSFGGTSHSVVTSSGGGTSTGFSESDSWGHSVSNGVSDSISRSWGVSENWGEGQGVSTSQGVSHGVSVGQSEGWSEAYSQGVSEGWSSSWSQSRSVSDSLGQGVNRSTSEGAATGQGWTQALGLARSMGVSGGVAPSVGANKTYQWVNDNAILVGDLLRILERMLKDGMKSGLWMTDVYTLTDDPEAMAVIEAAARSAFGGVEDVVTAVQARGNLSPEEQLYLRLHAACFTPATMRERVPGLEAYRHSQMLNPLMLATYTSPSSMEQGTALTVAEMIPDFAFRPQMGKNDPGRKATLGFQYSTETGDLLATPVVLSEGRHTHTVIQGMTGSGKSEAAFRLGLEVWKWGHRMLVLDFGRGWDRFFNSEIPKRYFDLYQLWPDSPRPLRWPVLMVPELLHPEAYVTLVCKIIANAGQLGQVQAGLMQESLRDLYVQNGVLLEEEGVIGNAQWCKVTDEEAARVSGLPAGLPITELNPDQAQALAVFRSRAVSLKEWVRQLRAIEQSKPPTDRMRQSLASLLVRLSPLTRGQQGKMFGALADDEDAIAIDRLGMPSQPGERPGFVVVQGGDRLDDFTRSFLLGLLALVNYESAKIRFARSGSRIEFFTDVIWEEAQKVLCGSSVNSGSNGEGTGSQAQTIEEFARMWTDGRKYGFFQWPIVQNLSLLPGGIVSSCNNGFFFRSDNVDDQKIIMTKINRSPQGFVDQRYQRFWARMPTGCCVFKAGNARDVADMEPILMEPVMVPMVAPTEEELRFYYDTLAAVRGLMNDV